MTREPPKHQPAVQQASAERAETALAESTLEMALRHVDIGERLVLEQQALVDRLRGAGETVSNEAERLLRNLRQTLALMHAHVEHERSKNLPPNE